MNQEPLANPDQPDMTLLAQGAAELGLALSAAQLSQFARYQTLLLDWNSRMSLTAIRDPAGIQQRLFLETLSCAPITGDLNEQRLVDVGAGAGFPGLPLKILYPSLSLTLVESVAKKARFLTAVVEALELPGVEVITDRAENLGHVPAHRAAYDWAAARAVAAMPVLAEYLLPLCRIGGRLLAQKGPRAFNEVEQAAYALDLLGGGQPALHQVSVPGLVETRVLVVVPKIGPTPDAYPRRPGTPASQPLTADS